MRSALGMKPMCWTVKNVKLLKYFVILKRFVLTKCNPVVCNAVGLVAESSS